MKRNLTIAGAVLIIIGAVLIVLGLGGDSKTGTGTGKIHLVLTNKPTLITAAYKVYGDNEAVGGKYFLAKLSLRNDGDGSLNNVRISYQIPDYVNWTTPDHYAEILPGQTIVSPFYPQLPSSVTKITSLTPSRIEVKIEYNDGTGEKSRVEKRDFKFRGVQEIEYSSLPNDEIVNWYDALDNSELNSAWVTEQDPIIGAYYGKLSELSGGFGTMANSKDIEQLTRSLYDFMVSTGMTYSGTAGVVEQRNGQWVLTQSMRLPRDVIVGNSGLCVELAQLWASVAMRAGAQAYLVMIPGHCFPVIKTSDEGDGSMIPIEATGIGGAGGANLGNAVSYEQAVQSAAANLQKIQKGEIQGIIVNIAEYRNEGIRAPELPEANTTDFLNMLDKRIKDHRQQQVAQPNDVVVQGNNQGNQGGQQGFDNVQPVNPQPINPQPVNPNPNPVPSPGPTIAGTQWADPQGRIRLSYPANWPANMQLVSSMRSYFPGYMLNAADTQTGYGVDIIFFDGITNATAAMNKIASTFQALGANIQFGDGTEVTTEAGNKGIMFPVAINSANGMLGASTLVMSVPGGVVTITIGGPIQNAQLVSSQMAIRLIFGSIQVAR